MKFIFADDHDVAMMSLETSNNTKFACQLCDSKLFLIWKNNYGNEVYLCVACTTIINSCLTNFLNQVKEEK